MLGIDTCGPMGSVALGRLGAGGGVTILGEKTLEGRTYSATLVAAVGELLADQGMGLGELSAVAVVNGPGSFTGVRVGVSAAKGLASGAELQVVGVSRLEVLARRAGTAHAALDAHRHEVFLRVKEREGLAGRTELEAAGMPEGPVAVCDEAAEKLLKDAWAGVEIVRAEAPSAADALGLVEERVRRGDFDDVALLDGHYLRRSDAEIFGKTKDRE